MRYFLFLLLTLVAVACEPSQPSSTVENLQDALQPTSTPQLLAPGEVSRMASEYNTSFSPDGNTLFYTITTREMGVTGIVSQAFFDGHWETPIMLPFNTAAFPHTDVHMTADGQRLLFSTPRSIETNGPPNGNWDFNLWFVEHEGDGWSTPAPLPETVNGPTTGEFYGSTTASGTLYFTKVVDGNSNIYRATWADDAYQQAFPLPAPINTDGFEGDPLIARDESFLIFVGMDREDGQGQTDMYISFHTDSTWTPPRNLGPSINSGFLDGSPALTPDGNVLFFTSNRISDAVKNEAIASFNAYSSIIASPLNGGLNLYYVAFDPNAYR